MGGAACAAWLGGRQPRWPVAGWARDMHRALPAPGPGFGGSSCSLVPSTVLVPLDAAAAAHFGRAKRGRGTTLFSARRRAFASEAQSSKNSILLISPLEVPSVSISQGAFVPTHRRPEGPRAQQYVPSRDPSREMEQANSAGRGCVAWLGTG